MPEPTLKKTTPEPTRPRRRIKRRKPVNILAPNWEPQDMEYDPDDDYWSGQEMDDVTTCYPEDD